LLRQKPKVPLWLLSTIISTAIYPSNGVILALRSSRVIAMAVIVAGLLAATAIASYVVPPQADTQSQSDATECKGTASCITGTITRIVDGDTLDIGNTRIRLALVNTPEIGEEGYREARAFVSALCPVGSQATADEDDGQTGGSYGRIIAQVSCDGKVLNEELLKAGLAEILPSFCARSEFGGESWAREYGC
jgi:endonuclease YncB( thermonuclease family)